MNFKKTGEMIKDLILDMVIKSAITFEEDSRDFYEVSMDKVTDPESKNLLNLMMNEENAHILKLRQLTGHDIGEVIKSVDVSGVKMLDERYIEVQRKINPGDSTADILKCAIDREMASFQFYSVLSVKTAIEQVKQLFAFLAKEEENHKKRLEIEYLRITGQR